MSVFNRRDKPRPPKMEDFGPFRFPDPFVTVTGKTAEENRPKPLLKWIWSFFFE